MLVFSRSFVLEACSRRIREMQKILIGNSVNIFANTDLKNLEELESSIISSTTEKDKKIILSFSEAGLLNIRTTQDKYTSSIRDFLRVM